MTFGERLKIIRKQKHLSQVALAMRSGVSQQAISGIESGRNSPSEATIRMLAKSLNCTFEELFAEDIKQPAADSNGSGNTQNEIATLLLQLSEEERTQMRDYAAFLVSRHEKQ